jgi:hypothetical protein
MLMTGVLMVAVSSALPSIAQTISAGVRDLAFAGMGIALLMDARHCRQTAAPRRSTPNMSHTSPHLLAAANRAANKLMLPYLRSHAGRRAGRRLAVIEYDGRRSGERHELVTGYLRDGRTVRIRVGQAKDKTWWRNFSTPRPMDIRLAGENHRGTAHTERDGDRVSVVVRLEA